MTKHSAPQRVLEVLTYNGRLRFLGGLALVCLLALSSQPASAQVAFGSIVGNVTDASGGAMAGASVKITQAPPIPCYNCRSRTGPTRDCWN